METDCSQQKGLQVKGGLCTTWRLRSLSNWIVSVGVALPSMVVRWDPLTAEGCMEPPSSDIQYWSTRPSPRAEALPPADEAGDF
eukprot:scaffold257_cov422-Prasinococcus_capsulatus_cf.AAC.8